MNFQGCFATQFFSTLISKDCEKYSPIYEVDTFTTYKIIEHLLEDFLNCTEQEAKLDVDEFNFKDTSYDVIQEMTGLMLASKNGLDDIVSAFIVHKADVNILNSKNNTALGIV